MEDGRSSIPLKLKNLRWYKLPMASAKFMDKTFVVCSLSDILFARGNNNSAAILAIRECSFQTFPCVSLPYIINHHKSFLGATLDGFYGCLKKIHCVMQAQALTRLAPLPASKL
ncbi:hypothetical protein H5410_021174 [Solanum commersonii]|uniref:Uncharacterized protein n=1 Tax=Solanum commersonii TaxID=4109 RepID=A0A9J5ZBW8_SOLCO|nr:hypothetical protein H5410_021174 [Solanum commersonii]